MLCRPKYNESEATRCIMPLDQDKSSPCCHMGPIIVLLFCIIQIISLLYHYYTHYFRNQKCNLGAYSWQKTCQSAHPPLGISGHYTNQKHQGLNYQVPECHLPRWQLQQQAHLDRSCGFTLAIQHTINQSPNASTVTAMAARFSCQTWSSNSLGFPNPPGSVPSCWQDISGNVQ